MSNVTFKDIAITKFIFHIVHDGQKSATLMDDTPLGKFDVFFKERILEVIDGNRFEFVEGSLFLDKMLEINSRPSKFIEVSKELAREFHTHQDKRIKPGVMILMQLKIKQQRAFVLIKYDNENVITYQKKGTQALLSEISNTFSKNKNALQKSAIVYMEDTPYVSVIDHSEREHITQFFKGFLGVERSYDEKTLTEKLRECYINTIKEHKDTLPASYTRHANELFYEIVQKQKEYEKETFVKTIFGEHYTDDIQRTFRRQAHKSDIQGEHFTLYKDIQKPSKRKYRTSEGVLIQYSQDASDTVHIDDTKDDKTIITITTAKLIEEK